MKKYAIIVAGGTGTRMQGEVPKQFMLLRGKPVILYSMEALHAFDPMLQLILVIHPDYQLHWKKLAADLKITIPFQIADGGKTRFDSVKNGLQLINDEGLIAVHDAARPVIDVEFLKYIFAEAEKQGSALPGIALNDTIRMIDGATSHQLDRNDLRAIQTPQVFKVTELKRAYEQLYRPMFTDDASVMQSAGFAIHLVEGKQGNIKITHNQDFAVAEVLIKILNPASPDGTGEK